MGNYCKICCSLCSELVSDGGFPLGVLSCFSEGHEVRGMNTPGRGASYTCMSAGKRCTKWARRLGWRKRSRYRSIPGNWAQFKLLFRRAGLKWVRGWGYKFIDLLLFVTAALVIGKLPSLAVPASRISSFKLCCLPASHLAFASHLERSQDDAQLIS